MDAQQADIALRKKLGELKREQGELTRATQQVEEGQAMKFHEQIPNEFAASKIQGSKSLTPTRRGCAKISTFAHTFF